MSVETAAPRIAPLEPPYEPEIEAALRKWMPPGTEAEPLRLFRTLVVHDELASRMLPLGSGILGHSRVDPREREVVVQRWTEGVSAYIQKNAHVVASRDCEGKILFAVAVEVAYRHGFPLGEGAWASDVVDWRFEAAVACAQQVPDAGQLLLAAELLCMGRELL